MIKSTTTMLTMIASILEHAGKNIILPAFYAKASAQTTTKDDGSIVTATDLASQHFIQSKLTKLDKSITFLGEEMTVTEQLSCLESSHGHYWCLDPLDGTSNFTAGFPYFSISLALIDHGVVQLACIYDPLHEELFTAMRGQGAQINGRPLLAASSQQPLHQAIGFVDFKRLEPDITTKLATQPGYRSQRNIGSCALEWAWLAAGRSHFIIHGGEKLWDFSAGSLLAVESGCIVSDFDGAPLFPCSVLSSSVLATCSPTIHTALKLQVKN